MKAFTTFAAAALVAVATAGTAMAQDAHAAHGAHAHGTHSAHSEEAALATGEIKKVDKEAGKITIRHGEIKNLGMGAMTMVFRVKDAAMLGQVKAGDKVNFAAEKINGAITVVRLEAAK